MNLENVSIEQVYVPNKNKVKEKKASGSGIFMSGINLTNVIIGSGIITLPISFINGGFGFSIILLVLSSLITHFSVTCIIKLLKVTGKTTLSNIMFTTTGLAGFAALTCCQIIYPILICLSYSIITADNFINIFDYLVPHINFLQDRRVILAISIYGIVFPLSLFRNVSFLDKISFVSIACVAFYFLVVVIKTPTTSIMTYALSGTYNFINSGVAQALSVLAFSMGCQHCISVLYQAQKKRSVVRMTQSTHISIFFSIIVYIIIAICGYISFSGSFNGNMLTDFCDDDILVIVARITFAFTVILSSPLQVVAVREGIMAIIEKSMEFSWVVHVFITLLIASIMYSVAIFTSNLGIVVAVAGALAGAPIGFVLPGIAFIRGIRMGYKPNNANKISAYFLIIYGTGLTVLGVVMSLINSGPSLNGVRYWCTSNIDHAIITHANITLFKAAWN